MAETPFFQFYPGDYLAKTQHLTTVEHGAYLLLIMAAWGRKDCALPDDDQFLARTVGLSTRKWGAIKDHVMEFWELDDGYFFNQRLLNDRQKVKKTSLKNSESGAKGAAVTNAKSLKSKRASEKSAGFSERRKASILEPELYSKKNPPRTPPKKQIGNYSPDERERKWAVDYWSGKSRGDILIDEQVDQFRDHHLANGKVMKNWNSAWKTWVRNAVKFTPPQKEQEDELSKFFAR